MVESLLCLVSHTTVGLLCPNLTWSHSLTTSRLDAASGGADDWHSAITDAQWAQLYAYQISYSVRMVQLDVYPQASFGTSVIGSCCDDGVEQLISYSNTTAFPQAGLKTGAGMSTAGLYHYVTKIEDPATTWEVAQFAANAQFTSPSTAAVINNFGGREQMAFFTTWATDFSPTSNFLQHGYITWMTRGLYAGYRRVNLNTQIDDMLLETPIYSQGGKTYRVVLQDMIDIRDWIPKVSAKMNPGSFYKPEIGYNGNGNLIIVDRNSALATCSPHPVYTTQIAATPPEFQKPLGSGVDNWPKTPTTYNYTSACLNLDDLSVWFQTTQNRQSFFHLSHTFTHESLNNATYSDVYKEISFNQKWLAQTKLATADNFSGKSLIPPAITGMHNGDALRAFSDLGLRNCVGDNARPVLRNQNNNMWPYITTSAANGFAGFTIIPRWPLRIYYDCDSQDCTYSEWANTGGGTGGFSNLMVQEKNDIMRYYFGLLHDGVMFHQMNLRTQGMPSQTMADGTVVNSLFQGWVEQTVQEFSRLANWPMISLKQDDLAQSFIDRLARDGCGYGITWNISNKKVTGVTVTAKGNTCSTTIPVTIPGGVTNTQGFKTEKVGNDPFTIWVKLSGQAVSFTLSTPIAL
jgi:hypothetical protein